jgi:DNA-directed RNA polymerase specialized sigma24 family protein
LPDDCRPHQELARLSNEELLDYLAAERDAGRPDCAKRALEILAFGYWDHVRLRVWRKVPREDVDDVTATVIESAISSSFDGRAIGQFVSWLNTITQFRIADYHRRREREAPTTPLPEEHEGAEEIWGATGGDDAELAAVAVREAAGRVLETRSPLHQDVIRLYGPHELNFMACSAAETAERVMAIHQGETMSEDNVHQIWSRYNAELHRELGLGGS